MNKRLRGGSEDLLRDLFWVGMVIVPGRMVRNRMVSEFQMKDNNFKSTQVH